VDIMEKVRDEDAGQHVTWQKGELAMAVARKGGSLVRKILFYIGIAVIVFGGISFLHAIVAFLGRAIHFAPLMREERTEGAQLFGSMLLMVLGAFLAHIGARGLAKRRADEENASLDDSR
jgi:hypothetical protein